MQEGDLQPTRQKEEQDAIEELGNIFPPMLKDVTGPAAPLGMDPPPRIVSPPPGVGAALCGLRAALPVTLPERCVDFKICSFVSFSELRPKHAFSSLKPILG